MNKPTEPQSQPSDSYTQTGFSEEQRQKTSLLRNQSAAEPPKLEALVAFLKSAQADLDKNRKVRNAKQQDVDFF